MSTIVSEDPERLEDPKPVCRWIWNGKEWAEHPSFPHNCPFNEHCAKPGPDGGYIGQEVDTHCTTL